MAFGAAAMDAAVNSSSVEEFMDNGNWGTVGSTILSGIVGGWLRLSVSRAAELPPEQVIRFCDKQSL